MDEIVKAIPEDEEEMDVKRPHQARLRTPARKYLPRRRSERHAAVPMAAHLTRFARLPAKSGLLPRVHGSALFTRGETQALATLTLGTKEDMQRLDLLFEQDTSSASCCTTISRHSASAK